MQTLQDKILQAQGVFANLCSFDFLLITPEKLRLTFEGNVEIDSRKLNQNSYETHQYLHPQVINIAKIRTTHLEKIAIYSLGKTLLESSVRPASLELLLSKMTSEDLDKVPQLLPVMREVEKFWREEVGSTPTSTLISQLCQLTLGSRPGGNHGKVVRSETRVRSQSHSRARTEFSKLNTSSSSDSADELRCSTASLPKPPARLPLQAHPLNSPFGASMPTLLDNDEAKNIYKRNIQQRKYGKRLEFKPPMTQKLQRKFGPLDSNLDRSKSHSATELPGLRSLSREKKKSSQPRTLTNARRLYRIVKPLAPSRFPLSEEREKCIGPEFVVRSAQPIIQLDLSAGTYFSQQNLTIEGEHP